MTDTSNLARATVHAWLRESGYDATLKAFEQDAQSLSGWSAPKRDTGAPDLRSLIEAWQSEERVKQAEADVAGQHISSNPPVSPLTLVLPGPAQLPYRVVKTHRTLHSSNMLTVTLVALPERRFDTSLMRYTVKWQHLICTTAADRRIVFAEPSSGEMRECFEPSSQAHMAAVLSVAQNPVYPRELVSSGIDAKVVVWDLLKRKSVQMLCHHNKHVVKVAFSVDGVWLASCAADHTVRLYRRNTSTAVQDSNEDDEGDEHDLQTRYKLTHTIQTRTSPEALLFVRAATSPASATYPQDASSSIATRNWLAFTVRESCCLYYCALPLDAEQIDSMETTEADLPDQFAKLDLSSAAPTPAFAVLRFNTNVNVNDFHVSYSLLALQLHPLGSHISIQTGEHALPAVGNEDFTTSLSRILLLPVLSSERTATLYTSAPASAYASPRHAWLRSGAGVWTTAEDGILRLIDVKNGKLRASIAAHGAAVSATAAERVSSFSRGGSSICRDVVVLGKTHASASLSNETVASVGFDRTCRIVSLDEPDESGYLGGSGVTATR